MRALVDVGTDEAKVRLPATLCFVLEANERKIIEKNAIPRASDGPSRIRVFLQDLTVHLVNEALN